MIGIEVHIVEEFQRRYFRAFPAIRLWHQLTIQQLATTGCLITPLGRIRYFYKRLDEDSTHREAIAHVPQSCIGELLNYMLYRVWAAGPIEGLTVRNNQPGRPPVPGRAPARPSSKSTTPSSSSSRRT